MDGVFGWGYILGTSKFSRKFGLPVDGLAGAKTKQMLVKATKYDKSTANKGSSGGTAQENKPSQNKGTNVPNGYSQNDIQLMANAQYMESLVVSRTRTSCSRCGYFKSRYKCIISKYRFGCNL